MIPLTQPRGDCDLLQEIHEYGTFPDIYQLSSKSSIKERTLQDWRSLSLEDISQNRGKLIFTSLSGYYTEFFQIFSV